MAIFNLTDEWSALMESYRADHQNPINQACHTVGIPLNVTSVLLASSVVGLPLAALVGTVGWTFQLVGHAFEGKPPSFVGDRRALLVGVLWWTQKVGLPLVADRSASPQG